jgi:hypothetical protein
MTCSRNTSALALCLAVAVAACDGESAPPREHTAPSSPATQTSITTAPLTAAASAPSGSTSAADAGADAGPSLADVVGSWEGSYDAKKGSVGMPSGVPDPARKADDGKVASGPGSLKITVEPDGDVHGQSQGALGSALIRGKIDGKMLRASFVAENLAVPPAMSGALVGIIKGDTIQAELRVAGPDALLVRQANFDIKKKN